MEGKKTGSRMKEEGGGVLGELGVGKAGGVQQEQLVMGQDPVGEGPGTAAPLATAPAAAVPEIDYDKLAAALAPKLAPQMATIFMRSNHVETAEMEVGQVADIMLEDGSLAKGGNPLEAIDKPLHKEYLDELAFMEEVLEVMVHETEDPNAENPVIVGVNGIFKPFFRGHATVAKRKFVDALIVKTSRVTTPETTNGAGERTYKVVQHNAQKFPISIICDRNPKGVAWLKRRMAEAV